MPMILHDIAITTFRNLPHRTALDPFFRLKLNRRRMLLCPFLDLLEIPTAVRGSCIREVFLRCFGPLVDHRCYISVALDVLAELIDAIVCQGIIC
jgi:hypothetical protein